MRRPRDSGQEGRDCASRATRAGKGFAVEGRLTKVAHAWAVVAITTIVAVGVAPRLGGRHCAFGISIGMNKSANGHIRKGTLEMPFRRAYTIRTEIVNVVC